MNSKNKEQITFLIVTFFAVLFLFVGNRIASTNSAFSPFIHQALILPARVETLQNREVEELPMGNAVRITITLDFQAVILRGERKGELVSAQQVNDSFLAVGYKEVEPGDKVLLYHLGFGEENQWLMHEYIRSDTLLWLGVLFMAGLVLFGRRKGFHSVLALSFTCLAIFVVFIPAILGKRNIYGATVVLILYIAAVNLLLINGANTKSLAAGVGLLGGLFAAGAVFKVMDVLLKLTGYINEESVYLIYLRPDNPIDLKAILFAGIILGALGATLDVAVSIASALQEVRDSSTSPTFGSLMQSGFHIGQDVLGTMTNTLVLAYIGSSLSLVLILIAYSDSLLELLNKEMIVVEILQSLAGSIGLLTAIPLTTAFSAYLYTRKGRAGL